jgi:pSer/pThr/pTyr-binding forkhead associated (FHA) protein
MPFCTQCGNRNPDDAKFCAQCGSRLVMPDASTSSQPAGDTDPIAGSDQTQAVRPVPAQDAPSRARSDQATQESAEVQPSVTDTSATATFGAPQKSDLEEKERAALDDDDAAAVDALPRGSALLVVQRGPGAGNRFLLDQDVVTAGRHPESEIFLDDITVSRRHVEFRRTSDGFTVSDVGSLNGTYVNRDRIDEAVLANGDEVQIGKFRLVYFAGDVPGDR